MVSWWISAEESASETEGLVSIGTLDISMNDTPREEEVQSLTPDVTSNSKPVKLKRRSELYTYIILPALICAPTT